MRPRATEVISILFAGTGGREGVRDIGVAGGRVSELVSLHNRDRWKDLSFTAPPRDTPRRDAARARFEQARSGAASGARAERRGAALPWQRRRMGLTCCWRPSRKGCSFARSAQDAYVYAKMITRVAPEHLTVQN